MVTGREAIGGNLPPGPPLDMVDPTNLFDVTLIPQLLDMNFQELLERRRDLRKGIANWIEDHTDPATGLITVDEGELGDIADFRKQLREFSSKEVEPARKSVKGPVDKIASAIQKWFVVDLTDDVANAAKPIDRAYDKAVRERDDRLKNERRDAARKMADTAAVFADAAQRATAQEQRDVLAGRAADLEAEAIALAAEAQSLPKELTQVRGDFGAIGGIKTAWTFVVENLIDLVIAVANGQQPAMLLMPNADAIDGMIKASGGNCKIPGITIIEERKVR